LLFSILEAAYLPFSVRRLPPIYIRLFLWFRGFSRDVISSQ